MGKINRRIIRIDEEKCDGCGICADACHEGAIQIFNGKAKLVSESYCDGLGDCIGPCPRDAISIEERNADEYDKVAVQRYLGKQTSESDRGKSAVCSCPGSAARDLKIQPELVPDAEPCNKVSRLSTWPVQIKLVPPNAPFLSGADLLIAADCVPFAFPDFHDSFIDGRIALVGCPKLDDTEYYADKLEQIFEHNDIESVTVAYMEVPCCGGLVQIVHKALLQSGKRIPMSFVKIGINGEIVDQFNL